MSDIANLRTETGKIYEEARDAKSGAPRYTQEVVTGPIHYKESYRDSDPWLDLDASYSETSEIKGVGKVLVYPKMPNIVTVYQDRCGYKIQSRSNPEHIATVELVSIDGQEVTAWQKTDALNVYARVHPYRVGIWKDFSGATKAKATTMRWKVTEKGNGEKDSHPFAFRETPEAFSTADLTDLYPEGPDAARVAIETARTRIDDQSWYWDEIIPAAAKLVDTDFQIGASARDVGVRVRPSLGGWNAAALNAPTIWAGYNLADYLKGGCGLGFVGVAIGGYATITAATLTMTAYSSLANNAVKTKITGELVGNSAPFSDLANYQARRGTDVGGANNNNRTVAQVTWDSVEGMTAESEYTSPSIVSVIQEIVNQAAWANGNALSLFWDDHEDRSTHVDLTYRNMYAYDGSSAKAPKISVTWVERLPIFQYYYNHMRV